MTAYCPCDEWPLEVSLKLAREELNEPLDPKEAIRNFRSAILEKVAEPYEVEDDAVLLKFLRVRKFRQDRALSMFKKYSHMRKQHQHLYVKMTPQFMQPLFQANAAGMLPHRDSLGRGIGIVRMHGWDISRISVEDVFVLLVAMSERALQDPVNQINGFVLLLDVAGSSYSHLRTAGPAWCYFLVKMVQDIFPARIKEIHFINVMAVFYAFFSTVLPFLTKKLRKRIHIYRSDLTALHDKISPSVLPQEFGGAQGPFNSHFLMNKIEEGGYRF